MPLQEVWSGGQNGANIAGLRAAKAVGLKTGGWMPKGYRTKGGDHPEYAGMYGVRQIDLKHYPHAIEHNVRETNGTLIVGDRPDLKGCALTESFCRRLDKPLLTLTMEQVGAPGSEELVRDWIARNGIQRLNVSGSWDAPEALLTAWLNEVFTGAAEIPAVIAISGATV